MAGNTIQTSLLENNEKLRASYLAVNQSLQFSKTQNLDATLADTERRRSFIKYAISKISVNAKAAGFLLKDELEKYARVVDNHNGLNNYWEPFSLSSVPTINNPLEWKLTWRDPNLAVQYVEPLSCSSDNSYSSCINEQVFERDVEKVVTLWKIGKVSPRARKISRQEQGLMQNKVLDKHFTEDNYQVSGKQVETRSLFNLGKQDSTRDRQSSRPDGSSLNSGKINYTGKVNLAVKRNIPNENQDRPEDEKFAGFKTARTVLVVQQQSNKNNKQAANRHQYANNRQQPIKKSLGGKAVNSPFVSLFKDNQQQPKEEEITAAEPTDERLKSIEPKMIELIRNEIMDCGNPIAWDDIAGLERAKRIIKEIVVYPMLRPDIFTGLRRPPKGILLFGPPGTGKTLIGKCIASQSKSTFFSISASSLTSKWVGEGEKMVRALFAVAQVEQPSVVFIDEIDSLLCQRSETEHESSRRMKTEFLVQLDGASTGDEDRILVIGATNRPYELDEAARRRFVKRLYVPLPELEARKQIVRNLLKSERHDLTDEDIHQIAKLADGYSGADMTNLCKEASMGPIRSIPFEQLQDISKDDVGRVTIRDFKEALDTVRPSVSQKDLSVYTDWDRTYGTASTLARN